VEYGVTARCAGKYVPARDIEMKPLSFRVEDIGDQRDPERSPATVSRASTVDSVQRLLGDTPTETPVAPVSASERRVEPEPLVVDYT